MFVQRKLFRLIIPVASLFLFGGCAQDLPESQVSITVDLPRALSTAAVDEGSGADSYGDWRPGGPEDTSGNAPPPVPAKRDEQQWQPPSFDELLKSLRKIVLYIDGEQWREYELTPGSREVHLPPFNVPTGKGRVFNIAVLDDENFKAISGKSPPTDIQRDVVNVVDIYVAVNPGWPKLQPPKPGEEGEGVEGEGEGVIGRDGGGRDGSIIDRDGGDRDGSIIDRDGGPDAGGDGALKNEPPVITDISPEQTAKPGQLIDLWVKAEDPDAEDPARPQLYYLWRTRGGIPGFQTNGAAQVQYQVPDRLVQVQVIEFTVEVSDGKESTFGTTRVMVLPEGQAGLEFREPRDGATISPGEDLDPNTSDVDIDVHLTTVGLTEESIVTLYVNGAEAGQGSPVLGTAGGLNGDGLLGDGGIGDRGLVGPGEGEGEGTLPDGALLGEVAIRAALQPGKNELRAAATAPDGSKIEKTIHVTLDVTSSGLQIFLPDARFPGLFGPNVDADNNVANGVSFSVQVQLSNVPAGTAVTFQANGPQPATETKPAAGAPTGVLESLEFSLTLLEGEYDLRAEAQQDAQVLANAQVHITVDTTRPILSIIKPEVTIINAEADADPAINGAQVDVAVAVDDVEDGALVAAASADLPTTEQPVKDGIADFGRLTLPEGAFQFNFSVEDGAGNVGRLDLDVLVDTIAPAEPAPTAEILGRRAGTARVTWMPVSDSGGGEVKKYLVLEGTSPDVTQAGQIDEAVAGTPTTPLSKNVGGLQLYEDQYIFIVAEDAAGNHSAGKVLLHTELLTKEIIGPYGAIAAETAASGDFDGDQRADLLLGDPGAANGRGLTYLIRGVSDPTRATVAEVKFNEGTPGPNAKIGAALAMGDVLGLTAGEKLIIGAPGARQGAGRIYVLDPGNVDGTGEPLALIEGLGAMQLGASLETEMDFDGDGTGDLAAGAPGYASAASAVGRVYAFYSSTPAAGSITLANALLTVTGLEPDGGLGQSLAYLKGSASDGKDLLAIGAPKQSATGAVNLTGATGMLSVPLDAIIGQGTGLLSPPNPGATGAGQYLSAGDFNGDGKGDLLVSTNENKIIVYLTGTQGLENATTKTLNGHTPSAFGAIGDLDQNGLDDAAAETAAGELTIIFNNDAGFNLVRQVRLANTFAINRIWPVGDFNNDGWPDFLVASLANAKRLVLYY